MITGAVGVTLRSIARAKSEVEGHATVGGSCLATIGETRQL
jgi:hypothetical protein